MVTIPDEAIVIIAKIGDQVKYIQTFPYPSEQEAASAVFKSLMANPTIDDCRMMTIERFNHLFKLPE